MSTENETDSDSPGMSHGYWKSIAELEGKAIYQTDEAELEGEEFPAAAEDDTVDPLSRRNFFQLMGASMALAGVAGAGCKRYQKEEIVPLARRPEDQVPGTTTQYASVFELGGAAQALLVTSYEGRPIKIDGNPEHPFAGGGSVDGTARHGGSSAFAQASILSLYDPDRSQSFLQGGKPVGFKQFETWLASARPQLAANSARVRFLAEATSSPTVAALRRALKDQLRIGEQQWYEWEPISNDNERAGMKLAFGRVVRPLARLDKAETIVALDCDLFVEHPAALRHNRDWAKGRKPNRKPAEGGLPPEKINRLWAIESLYTTTGGIADHRLPLRSEHVLPFVMALDAALAGGSKPPAKFLDEGKVPAFFAALVEDLKDVKARGGGIVIAGRRQPPQVHALCAKLNEWLGAIGNSLEYVEDPEPDRPTHVEAITRLAREIEQKQVETLIILGGNPVYDAPADLAFANLMAAVPTTIHLSEYANETSQKATWHVPRAHYLESWGDARTWDGTITLGQPLIMPMYGGITIAELLALLLGDTRTGDTLVRGTYGTLGLALDWKKALHDGFLPGTALQPAGQLVVGSIPAATLTETQLGTLRTRNGQLEVVFAPSTRVWDGRYANNAWLQETPDFMTKVTWDNHAMVSPATAKELGVENDHLIKIKLGDKELEVACYVMPGQARYSIGVILGGGRSAAGVVGGTAKKQVGFDTYRLRRSDALDIASGATVTATGTEYWLANVQEHWDIRRGLDKNIGKKGKEQRMPSLVRKQPHAQLAGYSAETVTEYFPDPVRGKSLFREWGYPTRPMPPENPNQPAAHAWGMAIDLGSCTGCNSCVVACQAENNIPVVGKNQVFKNREMHWIRIDRYFTGSMDDPEVSHQPMLCQQCENAPCEQVCPVGATTHSDEGLNDQAYNRCIGTRYCLNNCPYRVRRFNFFDYHTEFSEARNRVRKLLFNPEVTVRSRGVMEKCTWCVQRIQNAKITARAAGRPLADGDIVTACQAACPAEAIVFGDLADPNSRVAQIHANDKRAYGLLDAELYTRPRNKYLAKVTNPHPSLAPKAAAPHAGGHE